MTCSDKSTLLWDTVDKNDKPAVVKGNTDDETKTCLPRAEAISCLTSRELTGEVEEQLLTNWRALLSLWEQEGTEQLRIIKRIRGKSAFHCRQQAHININ